MHTPPDPSTVDGCCSSRQLRNGVGERPSAVACCPLPRRREDWSLPLPAAASSAKVAKAAPATVEAVAVAAVAVAAAVTTPEKPAMVDIEQVAVSRTAALICNGYPLLPYPEQF